MKQYIKGIALASVFLVVGGFVGYGLGFWQEHEHLAAQLNIIKPLRENSDQYHFINPLLAYIIPNAEQDTKFAGIKNRINMVINEAKSQNRVSDVSVFLSDLNRGRWIGIDESKKYSPASMLKVVIMVAYFKEVETNPSILQKKLVYTTDLDSLLKKDFFNSASTLEVKHEYTIEDLINNMIIHSDNGAEILLLNNLNENSLDTIYTMLNITSPLHENGEFTISPRAYSLFFRVLYSGTYLTHDMSEKALSILSKTTFHDGLRAQIPESVSISHKFGEYVSGENQEPNMVELHDCGIVYYPEYPYFLCVMTRGEDESNLRSVIASISNLVYQEYAK